MGSMTQSQSVTQLPNFFAVDTMARKALGYVLSDDLFGLSIR